MTTLMEPSPPWLRDPTRFTSTDEAVLLFVPPVDLVVTDDGVIVQMDVPGVRPESLEVELDGEVLTVRGERQHPYDDGGDGAGSRMERGFGRFARSVRIPGGVDPDAIEAALADGVLTLRIPRPEPSERGRVRVTEDGAARREVSRAGVSS